MIRHISISCVLAVAALGLMSIASCGDDKADDGVAVGTDTTLLDTGIADTGGVDTNIQVDTVIADTGDLDTAAPDTTGADTNADTTVVEGGFGWPCADNDECDSGFCTEGPEGQQCTKTCVSECPPGFACKLQSGAGDPIAICLYEHVPYCRPCDAASDCAHPVFSGLDAECRSAGPGAGSFCATPCDGAPCPPGAACETLDFDGESRQVCVPESGECGCSPRAIEEGASTACSVGNDFGTCEGRRTCLEDGLTACDAPVASAESCNGIDDDCNGAIDDGFENEGQVCDGDDDDACEDGVWICDGSGALSCTDDAESVVELCNGADDDCDGQIDETFADGSAATYTDADGTTGLKLGDPCGVGACAGGVVVCGADGVSLACSTADGGGAETCDGIDNDCDGQIDEDTELVNDLAALAAAGCETTGVCGLQDATVATCTNGAYVCSYVDAQYEATETLCDNLDNDCDGAIDEDIIIGNDADALADTGCKVEGVCALFGSTTATCNNGVWSCNYLHPAYEATEVSCDTLDNDCNGVADDDINITDLDGLQDTGCGVLGVCAQPGVTTAGCAAGVFTCSYNSPDYGIEVCDNLDNNCDGNIDEGLSVDNDNDLHFAIGSCAQPADDCNDGNAAANPSATEVCDGVDNDCDNSTDEVGAGGCTVYYRDNDNDGFGAGNSQCLCQPNGTFKVTNNTDCYDSNALAYPGQTTPFTIDRGDGSFDYNCDGVEEKDMPANIGLAPAGSCDGFLGIECNGDPGWNGSPPACGQSKGWLSNCSNQGVFSLDCDYDSSTNITMKCK